MQDPVKGISNHGFNVVTFDPYDISADLLKQNFKKAFRRFEQALESNNYVTSVTVEGITGVYHITFTTEISVEDACAFVDEAGRAFLRKKVERKIDHASPHEAVRAPRPSARRILKAYDLIN